MREIKFRCWFDNHMFKVVDIDFSYKRINLVGADIISFKDGILMQYTGLNDKNEKEIYEKDIIRYLNNKGYYEYCIVHYSGGAFRLAEIYESRTLLNYEARGYRYENSLCRRLSSKFRKHTEEFEVIGNVYETPEFLDVKYII